MSTIFGGISAETPKYSVVKALSGLAGGEIRKYAPQVRAEVLYASAPGTHIMDNLNSPFRVLAGYIFGGNSSRSHGSSEKVQMTAPVVMQTGAAAEKIAMTAPVVMQTGSTPDEPAAGTGDGGSSGQRMMAFIMPSKYTSVADLPLPKDARVTLIEVPERTFAAVTFRGTMSKDVAGSRVAELRAAAEREGVKVSGDPHAVQYCSYNPPWCLPWLRTNDILIPVVE